MMNSVNRDKEMVVLQHAPVWLPQTQTWMYHQVRHLPDSIDCHIVCDRTENLDQFGLPHIHSLSKESVWRRLREKTTWVLRKQWRSGYLVEQASKQGAEILHSHFGHIGWRNIEAARQAQIKHVVSFYGFDVGYLPHAEPVWRQRYHELFECVDRILCEGPHMAQCLIDLGCPKIKIRVHHLGVALDGIPFKPRVWKPSEPLRVLIAASFQEKKGIPDALEALARFRRQIPVAVTVIGDANDEPRSVAEKYKILSVIRERGFGGESVRLLGYQPYSVLLKEAYEHHVFMSPSMTASDGDTEGGAPITLIEMAASGMPAIATRHCDIPEVIHDGLGGLLANERDVEGLVHHLNRLVQNPERWQTMAKAARKHIEAEFDARAQAEKLADRYREILESTR